MYAEICLGNVEIRLLFNAVQGKSKLKKLKCHVILKKIKCEIVNETVMNICTCRRVRGNVGCRIDRPLKIRDAGVFCF